MISGTDILYPAGGRRVEEFLYRGKVAPAFYLLFPLLWLLSLIYSLIVRARVILYGWGILRSVKLDAYTVSVGNLTVGGTGKTPFVEKIASDLYERGGAVAVLSRGYRRSRSGGPLRVSPHQGSVVTVREGGDEPTMLASRLPGVPVIVDAKRSRGGEFAISRYGARLLILDDGFSHLALERDCDILLVDGERGFGPGWMLPLGPLREPLGHIRRADSILVIGEDDRARRAVVERLKNDYGRDPVMEAIYEPSGLVPLAAPSSMQPLEFIRGKRCVVFSGVASPARFEDSIGRLGGDILCSLRFPDHYAYCSDDMEMITTRAKDLGADLILTTEKDSVKIQRPGSLVPIYYLRIAVRIVSGGDIYESILSEALKGSMSSGKRTAQPQSTQREVST